MTDAAAFRAVGISPLAAEYYEARNAAIDKRNDKIREADEELQAELKVLREQYFADRALQVTDEGRAALAAVRAGN
jgi:hypothetical protein